MANAACTASDSSSSPALKLGAALMALSDLVAMSDEAITEQDLTSPSRASTARELLGV